MKSLVSPWTKVLKEAALRHGFMGVGISRAEYMDVEAHRLEEWLGKGYHGEMAYMANHFDKRVDPTKLVPGAKSVVSLMYNYFPGDEQGESGVLTHLEDWDLGERMPSHNQEHGRDFAGAQDARYQIPDARRNQDEEFDTKDDSLPDGSMLSENGTFKISRYAYGEDYHKVVRRKLKALIGELKEKIGNIHGRVFVDSAPVMERDWAKRSGQGWIGKNTLLIHPKKGSYFFLAEIIIDIELDYDHPMRDHCGTCTRCIDACPTDAISPEGYVLDASKCISYLTIELKSNIPETFKGQMEDWIFGCDICQEVCPWNRFAEHHRDDAFIMSEDFRKMKKSDWQEITEDVFNVIFEKSPLKRAGYKKLKSTIGSMIQ